MYKIYSKVTFVCVSAFFLWFFRVWNVGSKKEGFIHKMGVQEFGCYFPFYIKFGRVKVIRRKDGVRKNE
jgi:hypothetical protein